MLPDDGGPAFPRPLSTGEIIRNGEKITIDCYPQTGMTLRDVFAGIALQGMLAAITPGTDNAKKATAWAFDYADAMLIARKAGQGDAAGA